MTYQITLHGNDTAKCGDQTVTYVKGPIPRLARAIVDADCDDALVSITRDGADVFARDMPLSGWAGRSMTEGEYSSAKMVKFAPNPRFSDGSGQ